VGSTDRTNNRRKPIPVQRSFFDWLGSKGWLFPVITAAILRVGVWAVGLAEGSYLSPDSTIYWQISGDLFRTYSATEGALFDLALLRPPGYPAILAFFRSAANDLPTVVLLLCLVAVATVFLTYQIALRITGAKAAAIAAWWLALSPLHVVESSFLLSEISFSLFILAAIVSLSSSRDRPVRERSLASWVGAGLLVAAATFIRPIALYLPILVLLLGVIASKARHCQLLTGVLAFVAAFSLPIAVWLGHNHAKSGVVTFSTVQGINLALYRAVGAMMEEDGLSLREARGEMRRLVASATTPGMNVAEVSEVQAAVGIREILERPSGYVESAIKGLGRTLVGPGRADIERRFVESSLPYLVLPLTVASFISAMAMALLALWGLVHALRNHDWNLLTLVGLPLFYLLLVGSGQEADSRFRMPIEPLFAIFAASGLANVRLRHLTRATPWPFDESADD
jgi:4-amino-4-deoxy-L-arabinose transferase-like glycosyltransferase